MSFWAPAPKSPVDNGIPKKSLDMSPGNTISTISDHFAKFLLQQVQCSNAPPVL